MSIKTLFVPPLDPNGFFGPFRMIEPIGRMADVTLDVPYGEFARKLYVGVTGDVSLVKWDGTIQILQNMQGGIWHDVCSIMINTVGTTATDLVWGS